MGVPTASRFGEIYTGTGKASASADNYMYSLLAEIVANEPGESFSNAATEWGHEMEPRAVSAYEMLEGRSMEVVGFVTNDKGTVGCSPDRVNLEIKCPALKTHLKYLVDGRCPTKYIPQVQGCMLICEQDHWDFMSYHPDARPLIVRVERDEEYIDGLSKHLNEFIVKLNDAKALIMGEGNEKI
tara:strand:- start:233 stop:784 length:552 start_codon:yes stop_codon:yes gene_type:complete